MLHCEWYVGRAYYNRTKTMLAPRPTVEVPSRKASRHTLAERPRAEWIDVPVPAIIDAELFQRVQTRVQENRRFARRNLKREGAFLPAGTAQMWRLRLCLHRRNGRRGPPRRRRNTSTSTTSVARAWPRSLAPPPTAAPTIDSAPSASQVAEVGLT